MNHFHEILAEERHFCEQRKQNHMVEVVCVSLSSKSMEDDYDTCEYSDATSVSSVTLASSFDDDDIVTIHEQTIETRSEAQIGKHCSHKAVSPNDSLLTETPFSSTVLKLSTEKSSAEWNDLGEEFREIELYPQARLAYQGALRCGEGLEIARAYAGLGSVYVASGDINTALEYRKLAEIALAKADENAGNALSILRDEITVTSLAEDELNELFGRLTTLD